MDVKRSNAGGTKRRRRRQSFAAFGERARLSDLIKGGTRKRRESSLSALVESEREISGEREESKRERGELEKES